MRRTSTLRLLIIDRSELAKNMYGLLFRDLPGYRIEFAESADGLDARQRRAKPHVILINGNAIEQEGRPAFIDEYPTVLISGPQRMDLKELAREEDKVELVPKPFYPYDLITVINRVASKFHPLSGSTEPAPAPKKRRLKRSAKG